MLFSIYVMVVVLSIDFGGKQKEILFLLLNYSQREKISIEILLESF